MFRCRSALALVCSFVLSLGAAVAEDLATMLTYVSKDANALMIVNLKELLDSPVGRQQDWRNKLAQGTLLGSLPLAEQAETVVVCSKLLPGSLQNRWEIVIISTSRPYDLAAVAQAEKAQVQKIGNQSVVYTTRNSIIIGLSPTLMAVYSPAQRQDVARWLRARENREGKAEYSPVLEEAVLAIKDGARLAISLDVDETLETNRVRQFFRDQPILKEHKVELDPLARAFARMTGMHFRVNVALDVRGTFWAQFAEPVADYAAVMPALLFAALDGVGVHVEDYRKGQAQVVGKVVKVEATLSAEGLRTTVAMMQPNTVAAPVARRADATPPKDAAALAAEQLFRQVVAIANEAQINGNNSNNLYRAANVYDHAANRIDKLPLATTDQAIQEFAVEVSKGLREISTLIRSAAADIMVLENQIVTNVNVTPTNPSMYLPNPWGFNIWNPGITIPQYNVQTNLPQIVARQQTVLENANKQRKELWAQLQQKSTALRKALSEKYGFKF